jgi:signal transduction histidine kinase
MRQAPPHEHRADGNAQQFRAALRTSCDNPLHHLLHSLKTPATCNGHREARMDHLYDLLLATTNNLQLHRRAVKLVSLIPRVIQVVQAQAQGPPPRLYLDYPQEPVTLSADVRRLEWALARLILAVVHRSTRQAPVALTAALLGGDVSMRIGGPATFIELVKLPSTADLVACRPPAPDSLALSWDDVELALARRTIELHGGGVQIRRQKGGRGSHISLRLRLLAG